MRMSVRIFPVDRTGETAILAISPPLYRLFRRLLIADRLGPDGGAD